MTFNAAEKYQSQIPAIQTLIALGFKPSRSRRLRICASNRVTSCSTMFWSNNFSRSTAFASAVRNTLSIWKMLTRHCAG
jgi:hypothetical protein